MGPSCNNINKNNTGILNDATTLSEKSGILIMPDDKSIQQKVNDVLNASIEMVEFDMPTLITIDDGTSIMGAFQVINKDFI